MVELGPVSFPPSTSPQYMSNFMSNTFEAPRILTEKRKREFSCINLKGLLGDIPQLPWLLRNLQSHVIDLKEICSFGIYWIAPHNCG